MREFGRILHEAFIHFSPAATVGFIYLRFARVDQKTITEMSDEPIRMYIGRNIQLTMIRKLHILFTVFGLLSFVVNAQVVSIRPSMAVQGQTLTTTITCASGLFTQASPPMGMQDIYLQQGNTIITCNSFDPSVNIYGGGVWPFGWSDSLFTDFTIPLNVPSGYYDVHVTTYTTDPWNWMPIPSDNILQGGFFVGIAAGVLEGTVYFDSNQNGTRDTGDVPMSNMFVNYQPGGFAAITNSQGQYHIYSDTGSYTIGCTPPAGFSITSSPTAYSGSVPPSASGMDFGLYSAAAAVPSQNFSVLKSLMRCVSNGAFHSCHHSVVRLQRTLQVIRSPGITPVY
jgi:hypothetical protein